MNDRLSSPTIGGDDGRTPSLAPETAARLPASRREELDKRWVELGEPDDTLWLGVVPLFLGTLFFVGTHELVWLALGGLGGAVVAHHARQSSACVAVRCAEIRVCGKIFSAAWLTDLVVEDHELVIRFGRLHAVRISPCLSMAETIARLETARARALVQR